MTSLLNCIILKTNDESSKSDRYVDYLREAVVAAGTGSRLSSHIRSFNPLKFEYINLSLLASKLDGIFVASSSSSTQRPNYRCLIVTSRQTVEAIERSLFGDCDSAEQQEDMNASSIAITDSIESADMDAKVIVYCVGDATAERFRCLLSRVRSSLNPSVQDRFIIRTSESKPSDQQHKQNALQLARVIIDDYRVLQPRVCLDVSSCYALYPCSSIRKDDMCKSLNEAGITYDEIFVYEKTKNDESMRLLQAELDSLVRHTSELTCLAFFSPSGVDSVWSTPTLKALISSDEHSKKLRFVSIGPSTTQKLRDLIGVDEIYELTKPSPENLLAKLNEIY